MLNNFFENFNFIILILSFVVGLWISFIYVRLDSTLSYEKSFSTTLIVLTVLTTLIMNAISSSISLSLGLIGALSIVRFRTVLKNTLDMCFIFWCVAAGIGLGSNNANPVIITSFTLGIFLISQKYFENKSLLNFFIKEFFISIKVKTNSSMPNIEKILTNNNIKFQLKNSTYNKNENETNLIYSLKIKGTDSNVEVSKIQDELMGNEAIEEVSIFKPQNEINI